MWSITAGRMVSGLVSKRRSGLDWVIRSGYARAPPRLKFF